MVYGQRGKEIWVARSVGRKNKNNNIGNTYGEQDFGKGINMN